VSETTVDDGVALVGVSSKRGDGADRVGGAKAGTGGQLDSVTEALTRLSSSSGAK
jgi:hypothetical protein